MAAGVIFCVFSATGMPIPVDASVTKASNGLPLEGFWAFPDPFSGMPVPWAFAFSSHSLAMPVTPLLNESSTGKSLPEAASGWCSTPSGWVVSLSIPLGVSEMPFLGQRRAPLSL